MQLKFPDELAFFASESDGSDGCPVSFMVMEHATGESWLRLNGAIVQIIEIIYYLTIQATLQDISTTSIMVMLLEIFFPFLDLSVIIKLE